MASYFWVGGTGSWDGVTNHFATSSGGTATVAAPTSADDVTFDANSNATAYTVTVTATTNCRNMTWALPGTSGVPTFAGSSGGNNIFGSLTMVAGMLCTNTASFAFKSTGSVNIDFANVNCSGMAMAFNGVGGIFTLLNANNTGTLSVINGTLDCNNNSFTALGVSVSGSATRGLKLGSGTLTIGNNGFIVASATGLTFDAGTSTIKFTGAAGFGVDFQGAGLTYNILWIAKTGAGSTTISGSNTFSELKFTSKWKTIFTNGTTQTAATFTATGSSGNAITFDSDTTGSYTVSVASGIVSCDWLNIQHFIATGGASWYAGANSTNNQATSTAGSGWVFTAPPPLVNKRFATFQAIKRSNLY